MTTEETQLTISEREVEEISNYYQIAKVNQSLLSVEEVLEATSMTRTAEELKAAWEKNSSLSARYSLTSGWLIEKGLDPVAASELARAELENRRRSNENLRTARDFARLCVDGRVRLLAMSGGNSYGSARERDDIDFFSITADDAVWMFMLKALTVARIRGLFRRKSAPLCFSYVVEEKRGRDDFGRPRDRLFARDALAARVLSGGGYYADLIGRSAWMKDYFPTLYAARTSEQVGRHPEGDVRSGNVVLNSLLFYTLGTYVKLRAFLLNRRFRGEGNLSSVFRADVGPDRCIYESRRYEGLRRMYAARPGDEGR